VKLKNQSERSVDEISRRLIAIFEEDENGDRPAHGLEREYYRDPHFKDLILFYEYLRGDSGREIGKRRFRSRILLLQAAYS